MPLLFAAAFVLLLDLIKMSGELNRPKSRMSGGSSRYRKLNFDDVTVEHECVLPGEFLICSSFVLTNFCAFSFSDRPDVIAAEHNRIVASLLSCIAISKEHPSTKKYFQSSESIHKEIVRHMFSNYWFIIHPFSGLRYVHNNNYLSVP